ncbi:ABC transporter permease [Intrasporangium oryzae NRRL B-24470]|uniref:ABC transporter permease n=1 Tax=Intrasporangium oryzae NRRL B-24470 TaxID=1386089 RepID=W9GEU0_9MICO|nr:ABC transporter permease [Intrasporangium oryzae]EWT02394.1 ABC transporter permease [Intrasporangium oryzae NRRL B-24470]
MTDATPSGGKPTLDSSPAAYGTAVTERPPTIETVHDPLSWRAEIGRQWGRRRTKVAFALILALPVILVIAFAFGDSPNGRRTTTAARFIDLAQTGSANFTLFTIFVSAELLLTLLAALFCGDSVPAEASWSSLRYLLMAPVRRARLLTSKLVIGLGTTALAMVVLVGWALIVGGLAYGVAPLTNPLGEDLSWAQLLPRLGLALAYIFVTLLPVAAIAFWIGVRSDAPLAAVGGAVLVSIVLSILDQIDALDPWRNALPGHYSRAWQDLIAVDPQWTDIVHGTLWSLVWAVAFTMLGYRRFSRADILS